MGENKNNESEEMSRISSTTSMDVNVRKVTKEALFSTREQKRAECVRKCRAVAEELTKNNAIKEMNYLLEDKVCCFKFMPREFFKRVRY